MPCESHRGDPGARGRSLLGAAGWLLPPILLGMVARLWGLPDQVLVGDEIHGLHAAVVLPWEDVFRFRGTDHCIPLAALFKVLAWLGVPLSEMVLRAPSVLAGLFTLLALPVAAVRWGGRRLGVLLAWLLALSPSLIYYSRIARPYALVSLLVPLAAVAFWAWLRTERRPAAMAYVAAGALGFWLHPAAAPSVLAALGYGVAELGWRRVRGGSGVGPQLRGLAATAGGLGLGIAIVLAPSWRSFRQILGVRSGDDSAAVEDVGGVLLIQGGSSLPVVAALLWTAAAIGLAVLLRRRRGFALFGVAVVAAQWVAIAVVMQPTWVDRPYVLNRYVLVALPVVLLWAARGLEAAWEVLERRVGRAGALIPVAAWVVLVAGGPLVADPYLRFGPFAGTNDAIALDEPEPTFPPSRVPEVYRLIAGEPGDEPVVEANLPIIAARLKSTIALSRLHGRPVILATNRPWLDDPRVALRTLLPAEAGRLCRSRARFLVVHRDRPLLERTARAWIAGAPLPPPRFSPGRPFARQLRAELASSCGEPYLTSQAVWLWDLDRHRRLATGRSPGPGGVRRPPGRGGGPGPRRPPPRPR